MPNCVFSIVLRLDGWADVRHDVSLDHGVVDVQPDVLDDDIADAADEAGLGLQSGEAVGARVAAQEEAVVGVRRGDARHADAGLREDVIHRQSHHVLRFHSCKNIWIKYKIVLGKVRKNKFGRRQALQ